MGTGDVGERETWTVDPCEARLCQIASTPQSDGSRRRGWAKSSVVAQVQPATLRATEPGSLLAYRQGTATASRSCTSLPREERDVRADLITGPTAGEHTLRIPRHSPCLKCLAATPSRLETTITLARERYGFSRMTLPRSMARATITLPFAALLAFPASASALEVGVRLEPGLAVPLAAPQSQRFTLGGDVSLKAYLGLGTLLRRAGRRLVARGGGFVRHGAVERRHGVVGQPRVPVQAAP